MKRACVRKKNEKAAYTKRFIALVKHPLFWFLTIAGNMMIIFGSIALYKFENNGVKPKEFIDSLVWSASIVTTIGYSSYEAHTFWGKLTVIVLMLLGTFFLWSYMAFLVSALISPALNALEKEVQDVEKELTELKTEENKLIKKELT